MRPESDLPAAATWVLEHASEVVTMLPAGEPPVARGEGEPDLGIIRDGAVVLCGRQIVWVGRSADLPPLGGEPSEPLPAESGTAAGTCREFAVTHLTRRWNLSGCTVIPGLVDAHTHLLFAGSRHEDFEARCRGRTYQEIARAGGGIRYTVRQTRHASDDELLRLGRERLDGMLALGTTTAEAKSGYGLDHEGELRLLRLLRSLEQSHPVDIVPTYLGAHEVPDGRTRQEYVQEMVEQTLPAVAAEGLARFADVFCEEGVYDPADSERILARAKELGLGVTIHAEQLHHSGGARLAAALGARSVSHLERATAEDLAALAAAGVTAVLLPASVFFLGSTRYPPARQALAAGVPVAVATDFNPGSAMSFSLPLAMTMACVQMRMTPAEVLQGATVRAAQALGLTDRGVLAPGRLGDLLVVAAPGWQTLVYHFGTSHTRAVFKAGELVYLREREEVGASDT